MKTENKKTENVINQLNQVLSDLQVVYQNLRTMHWLVKGPEFYMLHKLYEEYYTETAEVIDEVAERILMLGGEPLHTYTDYLAHAKLEVLTSVSKGKNSLDKVHADYLYLLNRYRNVLKIAADNSDEGTVALFSDLVSSTEKKIWMLNATLS
jgi:starvation-inducible DNA-binding protein